MPNESDIAVGERLSPWSGFTSERYQTYGDSLHSGGVPVVGIRVYVDRNMDVNVVSKGVKELSWRMIQMAEALRKNDTRNG